MKFIYILETGQLSRIENKFFFHEKEAFTTMKKVVIEAKKRIDINKGFGLVVEDVTNSSFKEEQVTHMTYECMSHGEDSRVMKMRYVIHKLKIQ
jgi:hypothetical protein